jgi:hypothetical protein
MSTTDKTDDTDITTEHVQPVGDTLTAHGRNLRARAGGVPRDLPPIPRDYYGLGGAAGLIVKLDEAREAFDQRLGDLLLGAGERVTAQVLDTSLKDSTKPFLPMPEAAR